MLSPLSPTDYLSPVEKIYAVLLILAVLALTGCIKTSNGGLPR
jgi:hypothetical protein